MHYVIGPVLDGIPACSVKQFAVPPFQIGICFPQFFHAIAYSAASGCGEWDERLASQVMALDESIDDSWSLVPPDGIADKNDIVGSDIRLCTLYRRTRLRIVHLHRTARLPVVPVKVIRRVG